MSDESMAEYYKKLEIPTLQPPLTPMIISYSELTSWDVCDREYYYRYGLNLKPTEISDAIQTGAKGHQLLQSFYQGIQDGLTKEKAYELTLNRAKKLLEAEKFADFNLIIAWTLVDNYIKNNIFTSEALLVENRFILPFSALCPDPEFSHVQIGFTPDIVFKRTGGFIDVEDSKFIQRMWSEKKLNRFSQAKIYQILLELMGYKISRTTVRFFNVKTGKILHKHYTLENKEREILIHDFVEGVKEVALFRAKDKEKQKLARRTMNTNACQYCFYEVPCTLEAEGKSTEKTFKFFFTQNDYSYAN